MREEKYLLRTYKMTADTGFAPNPFWGYLTLATCKPWIRKKAKTGEWIAGFSSKKLDNSEVGKEKLIFLMKVEKIIPLKGYFNHPEFENKIPQLNKKECIYKCGDNIYKFENGEFTQIENRSHTKEDMEQDLKGENVLASRIFWYFGENAFEVPEKVRPKVPKGRARYGAVTKDNEVQKFINWIKEKYPETGIYGKPHKWCNKDESWSKDEKFVKNIGK